MSIDNALTLRGTQQRTKGFSKAQIIETIISSFLLAFGLLFEGTEILCIVSSVLILLCMLVRHRESKLLFIVLLLMSFFTYSFLIGNYWGTNSYLDYSFDNGELRLLAARIVLVYVYFLDLFTNIFCLKKTDFGSSCQKQPYNPAFVIILLFGIALIWVLFYDFSFGTRAGYSPAYEYSIILFIFAYYYCGNNTKLKTVTTILALFYIVFDFLGGQRSTGVQIGLIVLAFLFLKRIRVRTLVVFFLVGLFSMNLLSAYRGSAGFSFSNVSFSEILASTIESKFSSDTASFAYYSSVVYLYAGSHFSIIELLGQFFGFFISQFVVGTVGEPITAVALNYHIHYYGGVLPIYLYYYLNYFGVILIAILTSFYFSVISRFDWGKRGFFSMLSIYITITSIRWYLYSPNPLIRGVFLFSIIYLLLRFFDKRLNIGKVK